MPDLLRFCALLVCSVVAVLAFPQTAKAEYLRSASVMSKCLGVASGNNGAPLKVEDCKIGSTATQQWTYNSRTGQISSNAYPSKCLHKATRGWGRNNRVHLWSCNAGTAEMKTWRYDGRSGRINARENEEMCFRRVGDNWANGTVVHLNGDCGSASEAIRWRLTSERQADCQVFDAVVQPNLGLVRDMINEYLPYERRINRRKTLVTHKANLVNTSGCDATINVDATMRRRIRRNASGYLILKAKLHSVSYNYICLRKPKVVAVKLSNLGFIGEGFYKRRGTKGLPDEMCVAF